MQGSDDGSLDRYDRAILDILSREGRLAITEIAKRVGLSKSPCQVRVRRLIDDGYILGFQAVLNAEKLDRTHIAFAEVKLSNTTEAALAAFNAAARKVPEIEQCHLIAGSFDYLLKVRTADISAYRRVLGETISALPHVASTSTHVSMEAVKEAGHQVMADPG
ncbi:winged helix-turn-helix transcriptional regulator [Halovulum dunhuangense]|uniref:Winged helix-turn-helix transcriptional regulator n=1 Tax=Halovulum dunhuangense TaxID=1505036 RepID=A0A849L1R8_9RHOB|nr:Lrp/AsnC ligand binding domain-containing protein [Halovulum dunhuangense]NNU80202.1 winged helix-turn-helix transcriptional regulator [Halovulum dunhuangense]